MIPGEASSTCSVQVREDGYIIGLTPLLRAALHSEDLRPTGAALLSHLQDNPDDANALMDLSTVLQLLGDPATALNIQNEALRLNRHYRVSTATATGAPARLRLLALMVPGDLMANTPIDCLMVDSDIALELLFLYPDEPPPDTVPDHDVLLVAIGECDRTQPMLARLGSWLAGWPRPVLNHPARIQLLSRDRASATLAGANGICMPPTQRVTRDVLADIAGRRADIGQALGGGGFPVIVRPLDSHAGKGLDRIDSNAALSVYLDGMADTEDVFYLSRFIDYCSADGLFRKYRVVLIKGTPHLCHLGISSHWMIHYLNAGMVESEVKREEEARAMLEFDAGFAQRHALALSQICQRFGLDYLGVDCAETRSGELLVFEVDTGMIVHNVDPIDLFPYKQPQMRKVFDAFHAMLLGAVQSEVSNEVQGLM